MNVKEEESNFETKVKIEDCKEPPLCFGGEVMKDNRNWSVG